MNLFSFLAQESEDLQRLIRIYLGRPDTCIFSSMVGLTFLEEIGKPAKLGAYYLDVYNPAAWLLMETGNYTPAEWDKCRAYVVSIRANPDIPPILASGVPYHVVIEIPSGPDVIIWDLARDQVNRPEKGIQVTPGAFQKPYDPRGYLVDKMFYERLQDWQPPALFNSPAWQALDSFKRICVNRLKRHWEAMQ